jgi:transcriptional regulator with XRE-family HTH domain
VIFAENLRTERKRLGLSQEELADIAGLHRTYVGSIERGERNVSIDNMEALANGLKVNLQSLLDGCVTP